MNITYRRSTTWPEEADLHNLLDIRVFFDGSFRLFRDSKIIYTRRLLSEQPWQRSRTFNEGQYTTVIVYKTGSLSPSTFLIREHTGSILGRGLFSTCLDYRNPYGIYGADIFATSNFTMERRKC
jgi:hypothetical protein